MLYTLQLFRFERQVPWRKSFVNLRINYHKLKIDKGRYEKLPDVTDFALFANSVISRMKFIFYSLVIPNYCYITNDVYD